MDVLAAIRRLVLRDHQQEHEEIGQELTEMRAELTDHAVTLRRLEGRAALRRKLVDDPAARAVTELVHVAQAIVHAGVGSFSFLEMAWLVIGMICLKDTSCAFLDARAQLAVASLPPVEDVQRLLAVIDHRLALEAVLVQVAFVLIGLVAAYRPAPPTTAEDHPLLDVAVVMLLMGVQVLHLAGAHHRHRALARVDRRIRSKKVVGGRRHDDPKEAAG